MSDRPDVPALRRISAERLAPGDQLWGVLLGPSWEWSTLPSDSRKGWALLDAEPATVIGQLLFSDSEGMTVHVVDQDGEPHALALTRQTPVLIEFRK